MAPYKPIRSATGRPLQLSKDSRLANTTMDLESRVLLKFSRFWLPATYLLTICTGLTVWAVFTSLPEQGSIIIHEGASALTLAVGVLCRLRLIYAWEELHRFRTPNPGLSYPRNPIHREKDIATKKKYGIVSTISWIGMGLATAIAVYLQNNFGISMSIGRGLIVSIWICGNLALCIPEMWLRHRLWEYMENTRVLQCADLLVLADSTSFNGNRSIKKWPQLPSMPALFRRWQPTGPISLPGSDDSFEIPLVNLAPREQPEPREWDVPSELIESVLHHSRLATDWHTHKALWIAADTRNKCDSIVRTVSESLTSETIVVQEIDVSGSYSVFWPLARDLASVLPSYLEELAFHPTYPFVRNYSSFLVPRSPSRPISPYNFADDKSEIAWDLIIGPLQRRRRIHAGSSPSRVVLLIHGLRQQSQADEIYATVCRLWNEHGNDTADEAVGIVVVGPPPFLRDIPSNNKQVMRHLSTLHVSDAGIMYSEQTPTPPEFYETIFLLLKEEIHRKGGTEAERIWKEFPDFPIAASESDSISGDDDPYRSTLSLFAMLHKASELRKHILRGLSELNVVPRSMLNKALFKDNIKIAETLQNLFAIRSYKKNIPALPREHALAVLNLIHYILDGGLPENNVIENYDIFALRAHKLLVRLADYLGLLPEEIAVTCVILLGEHPVKHGGFSNVYRGVYTNPNGQEMEVALKVLKIFEDQTDERRHDLQNKFSKEALVWHYLRHKNIVPFLGVDSMTFPSPARAMVSPWMPLGSALKYMGENSPSFPYALELLRDVVDGLNYLHSMHIVHGDMCARNILMDTDGRACLTDFGLATFMESDTSIQTSTQSGSVRWMAPELLLSEHSKRTEASDIWAFGCVCAEIWTEGDRPFGHIRSDAGIALAFSAGEAIPYQSKPHDKAGKPAPNWLWELVQWCWKHDPSERPNGQVIETMLSAATAPPCADTLAGPSSVRASIPSGSRLQPFSGGDSQAPSPTLRTGNGMKRVHFNEEATVRVGPLHLDGDPEEMFDTILDGLLKRVERDIMVKPLLVEAHGLYHLAIRFRSPLEANNFAMTWMVYRDGRFSQVSAELMD
ncbi:hypothetical protein B0H13DRAFT_1943315 [Mycena leptocephala]|nr:hypothetical protein B0H13DRAFT_1943315 [Mycena leptocephala]